MSEAAPPNKEQVAKYLATHQIKEALDAAVNAAIREQSEDPIGAIAAALVAGQAPPALLSSDELHAVTPRDSKKFFLGGNWKCKIETKADAAALCRALVAKSFPPDVEIVLFVPYVLIDTCARLLPPGRFAVGAQNCWDAGPLGGYTGCVTASTLKGCGVRWVLLGHSDRRNTLHEPSELIAEKAQARAPRPRPRLASPRRTPLLHALSPPTQPTARRRLSRRASLSTLRSAKRPRSAPRASTSRRSRRSSRR